MRIYKSVDQKLELCCPERVSLPEVKSDSTTKNTKLPVYIVIFVLHKKDGFRMKKHKNNLLLIILIVSITVIAVFGVVSVWDGSTSGQAVRAAVKVVAKAPKCVENWVCETWNECASAGTQTCKTVSETNKCGTILLKPKAPKTQACTPLQKTAKVIATTKSIAKLKDDASKLANSIESMTPEEQEALKKELGLV